MTVTIVGRISDTLGHAQRTDLTPHPDGRGITVETRSYAIPPDGYRHRQPARIALDINHGPHIGTVEAIERDDRGIWAVCTSDLDDLTLATGPLFYSSETDSNLDGNDTQLVGLAIVRATASINAEPVTIVPGDLPAAKHSTTGELHDRISRAWHYRRRRPAESHEIIEQGTHVEQRDRRPAVPLEYHGGGRVLSVR